MVAGQDRVATRNGILRVADFADLRVQLVDGTDMKLVIKPDRPRQRVLLILMLVLLGGIAIATAFHYGQWRSIGALMGSTSGQRGIMDEYVDLKDQHAKVRRANTKLTKSIEIHEFAGADNQKAISALQSEIADLKLEVAFYRDILSSTEVEKGPNVRGFKLRSYGGAGRFQYRLVLTHVNKDDKVAAGRVAVEIRGRQSGEKQRLTLADLAEPESGDLAFNFKHFRRIEGVLQLPDEFSPEEVRVTVFEEGRKKSTFSRTYNWSKIIN